VIPPADLLRRLPGYFAFNTGVMFFIGLATSLMSVKAAIDPDQLRMAGLAILLAVLAMAAGFASVARIEFARRTGQRFPVAWIVPAVLVGLPLGHAIAKGAFSQAEYVIPAAGVAAALAGMAWLALRARQEVRA
jgi:ABC-type amino acid transport system permease subunit